MATAADNLRITTDFSLRLCALLRQSGVQVGTQQAMACMQAVLLFKTITQDQLKAVYRSTLINRKQDLPELERAFALLMQDYLAPRSEQKQPTLEKNRRPLVVKTQEYAGYSSPSEPRQERARTEGYSVREVDRQKDFRLLKPRDMADYVAELARIAQHFAAITRRKAKRARRGGRIDLRATLRASARFGCDVMQLRFKRKLATHARFVIVCDVSGSMEIYAVFLLNLLHHLQRLKRLKIESFVFSTYLQSLTQQFRSRAFPEMLRNVAANFTGWSGGTKIGAAIQTLNDRFATSVTPRTTVIIMSDGWDTGEIPLLQREMALLSHRARAVLWINPLKGDTEYEPLAAGMAAARPYCDHFIPGHNIESFAEFARLIATP